MLAYIVRRILYAIPILVGVNLITFALFFVVNTPDDMARMQLGTKRVTPEAIEKWKNERGYDKPLLWPVGLILLVLIVSAVPAVLSYRRRERMAARPAT